jgi:hypothetical protein
MATPTEGDGELEQTVKLTTQELDDEDELDNGGTDSEVSQTLYTLTTIYLDPP